MYRKRVNNYECNDNLINRSRYLLFLFTEKIMDRNILFLTLSLVAVWFLMDDFVGKKRISTMVSNLVNGTAPGAGSDILGKPSPPLSGDPAPIPPNLATYPSLPTTPGAGGLQNQPSFLKPGVKTKPITV
jgi:hypothetical protein